MKTFKITEAVVNIKGWVWSPEDLQLRRDFTWTCPVNIHKTWKSEDGVLTIVDDEWHWKLGFRYNSASMVPSGKPDKNPDLPVMSLNKHPVKILWLATLVHDSGYRFLRDKGFPFKRSQVDGFFYIEMRKTPFKMSRLYWTGVRVFGGIAFFFKW